MPSTSLPIPICPRQDHAPLIDDQMLFTREWYLYFNKLASQANTLTLPFITPEEYGAVGDGSVDDTKAWIATIQAAIDTGKAIFASGTYLVSKQGTAVLPFDGLSHSYVFLVTDTITILGKPLFLIGISDAETANIFWFQQVDNVRISGIEATGNGTASTLLVYEGALLLFDRCTGAVVCETATDNMRGNTLMFQGYDSLILNSFSSIPGTNLAGSHFASYGCSRVTIQDCTAYAGCHDGDIVHFGTNLDGRATGNRILNCTIYNYAFGDTLKTIVFNEAQGFLLDSGQEFGIVDNSYAYGYFYGIDIKTTGEGNSANANTIEKCKVGIAVRRGEGNAPTYNTYLNNNVIRPMGGNGNTQDLFNSLTYTVGYYFYDAIGVTLDGGTVEASYLYSIFGFVNTSGTTVTRVSGSYFDWSLTGRTITINAVTYTVASVTSTTVLVLTGSAGTQTNHAFSFSGEQDYIPIYGTRTSVPILDSVNDGILISRVKFMNEMNVGGHYSYTRNISIYLAGFDDEGTVTTAGTAVHRVTGPSFVTGSSWNTGPIWIDGNQYFISAVSDADNLVTTTSTGSLTGVPFRVSSLLLRGGLVDCDFKMFSDFATASITGIPVQIVGAAQFTMDGCDFSRLIGQYQLIQFTNCQQLRISKISSPGAPGYINLVNCGDVSVDRCQFAQAGRNLNTALPVPIIYASTVSSLIVDGIRHTQGVSVDNGRLVDSTGTNGDLTLRNCQVQFTIFIVDWYAWNGTSVSTAANVSQSGNIVNDVNQPGSDFSGLTASRPLKLDASKQPTSSKIDGSAANDFAAGVAAGLVASTGTTGVLTAGTAAMVESLLGLSAAEVGYLVGITSGVQSQLNGLASQIASLQTDVLDLQNNKADHGTYAVVAGNVTI